MRGKRAKAFRKIIDYALNDRDPYAAEAREYRPDNKGTIWSIGKRALYLNLKRRYKLRRRYGIGSIS